MALLVDTAFKKFLSAINLPGDHRDVANRRKDWCVGRLNPYFDIVDAKPMGSIPKFTALKDYADLDVLVVLHFSKHIEGRTPAQVLSDVRQRLGSSAGSVRRNGQAVTMRFASWPNVDVVPASVTWADSVKRTVDHYRIPDMTRGVWLKTRPVLHARRMDAAASLNGEKFRHVIKMVKDWNRRQAVQLQSYHIEAVSLETLCDYDDYTWALTEWFETAQKHIWTCYVDGEDITEYLTGNYSKALAQLAEGEKLASHAWWLTYNGRGRHQEAITTWKKLFGQRFPSYGI